MGSEKYAPESFDTSSLNGYPPFSFSNQSTNSVCFDSALDLIRPASLLGHTNIASSDITCSPKNVSFSSSKATKLSPEIPKTRVGRCGRVSHPRSTQTANSDYHGLGAKQANWEPEAQNRPVPISILFQVTTTVRREK